MYSVNKKGILSSVDEEQNPRETRLIILTLLTGEKLFRKR